MAESETPASLSQGDVSGRPVDAILADYFQRLDRGELIDREQFLAAHPSHAAELRSYFEAEAGLLARAWRFPEPTLALSDRQGDAASGLQGSQANFVPYFGDYELINELARGGMGVVYKARQVSVNRPVALKMILSGKFASQAEVQRFRLEAEAAANLDHPHIVPIYEVGEHEGQHYFSMKLIQGTSLASIVQREGTMVSAIAETKGRLAKRPALRADEALRRGVRLMISIARAVHYAHQRGIVHRDLKPANILVDADGEPHVTDFGLARRTGGDSHLTETGAIVGTPAYMAPEQAAGRRDSATTAADIYSLGAMLYELLTHRPPFRGETALETLRQVVEHEPERPGRLNPQVDADLDAVCLKCLAKNPQERYSSTAALADDLQCWLDGEPLSVRPPTVPYLMWRWLRRNFKAAVWAILIGILGGLAWNLLISANGGWTESAWLADVHHGYFPSLERPATLPSFQMPDAVKAVLGLTGTVFCATGVGLLCWLLIRPANLYSDLTAAISIGLVSGVSMFIFGFGAETIWSRHDLRGRVSADLNLFADAIDAAAKGADARDVIRKKYADLQQSSWRDYPQIALRKKIDIELRVGLLTGIFWGTLETLAIALFGSTVQITAAGLVGRRSPSFRSMLIPYLELATGATIVGLCLFHMIRLPSLLPLLLAAIALGGVIGRAPWWCRWPTYLLIVACSGFLPQTAGVAIAAPVSLAVAILYPFAVRFLLHAFATRSVSMNAAYP